MSQGVEKDRNVVALIVTGGLFLLFVAVYLFPRNAEIKASQARAVALMKARQEIALLLPQVAQSAQTAPEPTPNVRAWITSQALKGIDQAKQVSANDGYLGGKGAKVKLRKLTPEQAAKFFSELTRVRLSVERMVLQDSDGDGFWDLEIDLKVPELS